MNQVSLFPDHCRCAEVRAGRRRPFRVPWIRALRFVSIALVLPQRLMAGDWPQILGPRRNGHAVGEKLPDHWPPNGPKVLWTFPVGLGYAGPAAVGDRVLVFHRLDERERLDALDRRTGQPLWHAEFPATYSGTINPDDGPRCVPLVVAPYVVLFGAAGDAHCVRIDTGQTVWSRQLYREYQGQEGYFGAGSTPVAWGDTVVFNVGGRRAAGLVALDVRTGKTLWAAGDEGASYSSPIVISHQNRGYIFGITRLNALLVDASDGRVLFRTPFGQRGPTVNAATPIATDTHVFLTASYGTGALALRRTGLSLERAWESDSALSSQYNTPVYTDGHVYGIHGREDVGVAELRCIRLVDGEVRWSQPGFGVAHLLLADQKLLVLKADGQLLMVRPNPDRFELLASAQIMQHTVRALPALSDGQLILRDQQNHAGQLYCVDLTAR